LLELLEQEEPGRFFVLGALGTARAMKGGRQEAERILGQLEEMEIPHSFGGVSVWQARIAAALENKDQAMAFLQRAFSQGTAQDDWLHRQPEFRFMIDYPPFKAFLFPDG